ncbi:hypothetical protein HPB48_022082 [Haemaphysalis longicornis]|uniref:Uncharacterized protein n=1 Tax=Haemaphysalis longicornis TaxID=44386 RepID=A0A9J6G1G3_HAELO|nr:hypothetical protein HPB48_022082 [Haemaphysalis longicornis]
MTSSRVINFFLSSFTGLPVINLQAGFPAHLARFTLLHHHRGASRIFAGLAFFFFPAGAATNSAPRPQIKGNERVCIMEPI